MTTLESRLRQMLLRFMESSFRSKEAADAISGFLIENFYDDEEFADLLAALSAYRPEGGAFLFNEDTILAHCKQGLERLDRR